MSHGSRTTQSHVATCPPAPRSSSRSAPEIDLAVELGDEAADARAAYGLSPGDETHPQPYAYVAPWVAPAPGELWQASGFSGAELSYGELLQAPDQRELVLDFFGRRVAALAA